MDQAEKLRKIMNSKNENNKEVKYIEEKTNTKKAKVISVSSGKGGVGKTNFAINFAICLKKQGYDVAIIDADIGLGNVEILSGVNVKNVLSDIMFSDKTIIDIMAEGPQGIKIISGGSGLQELILLNDGNLSKLIKEIDDLQAIMDYIIIDTGAGISPAVIDFVMASDEVIVVSTEDPTSIMDSYVLIKSITTSGFKGKINIIANLVANKKSGQEVYNKLNRASNNFLRVQTNYFGYMERDELVNNAVKNQIPFIVLHPNNMISRKMLKMTLKFLNKESQFKSKDSLSFAEKILNIFKKR